MAILGSLKPHPLMFRRSSEPWRSNARLIKPRASSGFLPSQVGPTVYPSQASKPQQPRLNPSSHGSTTTAVAHPSNSDGSIHGFSRPSLSPVKRWSHAESRSTGCNLLSLFLLSLGFFQFYRVFFVFSEFAQALAHPRLLTNIKSNPLGVEGARTRTVPWLEPPYQAISPRLSRLFLSSQLRCPLSSRVFRLSKPLL
ncbi:hypothetical protein CRG98_023139 [Punica granatum]|uniref:Uncharacterized protein n=1 Tax=Punica granatum TaxID=22663 RepID=A0A2I0JJP9_PUNGR|nr:hypothetical protein CRG98_023139 [Punica granatum]